MTGLEIAALVSTIGSTIGQIGSLFGGKRTSYNLADIDRLIDRMRARGAAQISGAVSRGKVAAAQSLAARGLGSSTITTGALGDIEQSGLEALVNLTGELSAQELEMIRMLSSLQQQEEIFKRRGLYELFGGLADIGATYLIGRYFPKTKIDLSSPYMQYLNQVEQPYSPIESIKKVPPEWWLG